MHHARRWSLLGTLSSVAISASLYAGPPYVQVGPPDRVSATNFLVTQGSSIQLRDMNNDRVVSDTDVALQVYDRLIAVYGPDLQVGDLDQDGVVSSEDLIEAIARVLLSTFGKVTPDEQPVGPEDVLTVVDGVMNASPTADVNLDGAADALDIAVPITNIEFDPFPLDHWIRGIALGLYDYIVVIQAEGREALMADEPVAADVHAVIVSGSWSSNPPKWWPPNHAVYMSHDWWPQPHWPTDHYVGFSEQNPGPRPEHTRDVSRRWTPNHLYWISRSWERVDHDMEFTRVRSSPLPDHWTHDSGLWPPGHWHAASSTWPRVPNGHEVATSRRGDGLHETNTSFRAHDRKISRGWWPQHTYSDSRQYIFPPRHQAYLTRSWHHVVDLSQAIFPPNHYGHISTSWPPGHERGKSTSFPPFHYYDLSLTWPAPQPQWPANHIKAISEQWLLPEQPGVWPLFPPDHTWFTTFTQIQPPGVIPRIPWAAEP